MVFDPLKVVPQPIGVPQLADLSIRADEILEAFIQDIQERIDELLTTIATVADEMPTGAETLLGNVKKISSLTDKDIEVKHLKAAEKRLGEFIQESISRVGSKVSNAIINPLKTLVLTNNNYESLTKVTKSEHSPSSA